MNENKRFILWLSAFALTILLGIVNIIMMILNATIFHNKSDVVLLVIIILGLTLVAGNFLAIIKCPRPTTFTRFLGYASAISWVVVVAIMSTILYRLIG